jgi:RNA recognition motif-containing protein
MHFQDSVFAPLGIELSSATAQTGTSHTGSRRVHSQSSVVPPASGDSRRPHDTYRSRNLYVAMLPITFTEPDIRGLLSPYGGVLSCRLINNSNAAQSIGYGYAFVLMDSARAADAAIAGLTGFVLNGKVLQIRLSRASATAASAGGNSDATRALTQHSTPDDHFMIPSSEHSSSPLQTSASFLPSFPAPAVAVPGHATPSEEGSSCDAVAATPAAPVTAAYQVQPSFNHHPAAAQHNMYTVAPVAYTVPLPHLLHHHHHAVQFIAAPQTQAHPPGWAYVPMPPAMQPHPHHAPLATTAMVQFHRPAAGQFGAPWPAPAFAPYTGAPVLGHMPGTPGSHIASYHTVIATPPPLL